MLDQRGFAHLAGALDQKNVLVFGITIDKLQYICVFVPGYIHIAHSFIFQFWTYISIKYAYFIRQSNDYWYVDGLTEAAQTAEDAPVASEEVAARQNFGGAHLSGDLFGVIEHLEGVVSASPMY